MNELFFSKNKNQSFKIIILFIIFFDLFFVGFYFGSEIIDRFSFLKEEFSYIASDLISISRFDIIKFSIFRIKKFLFFGYGSGSFESLFQLKFMNSSSRFANHAHSDLVEFFGEFGLLELFL